MIKYFSMVSVILPNYNHSKYLRQRIDTILNQTYQNFELIILDDASTDESVNVINEYISVSKISKVIFNKVNTGSPFVQWKKGIEQAQGEYIWIAESDDYSDLKFLEKCMLNFENDISLSAVFTHTLSVDEYGSKSTNSYYQEQHSNGKYHAIDDLFFYNWFFKNSPFRIPNASSCVFKKNIVNLQWFETIVKHRFSGDKFFWLKYITENPYFYYINEPLNYQRYHFETTRAKHGLLSEYQRNSELSEIYSEYLSKGFYIDKVAKKEIYKRLFAKEVYGIFFNRFPNLRNLTKCIFFLSVDISFYKKIGSTIIRSKFQNTNLSLKEFEFMKLKSKNK